MSFYLFAFILHTCDEHNSNPCRFLCREQRQSDHGRRIQARDQHHSAIVEWHEPSDQQEPHSSRWFLLGTLVITNPGDGDNSGGGDQAEDTLTHTKRRGDYTSRVEGWLDAMCTTNVRRITSDGAMRDVLDGGRVVVCRCGRFINLYVS